MRYSDLDKATITDTCNHVLVAGPQRSGTTIAAKILAQDLGWLCVDETEIGVSSLAGLMEALTAEGRSVVQGPCFSAIVHWIDLPRCGVVFMRRPLSDIRASEARIGWQGNYVLELRNYFTNGCLPAVRYRAWDQNQRHAMKVPYWEVDYDSLSRHPLWIAKDDRQHFTAKQTCTSPASVPPTAAPH